MQITNFRKITCILLVVTASASVAEAAEKLRWEELTRRFGEVSEDTHSTVVMKNGTRLRGLIVSIHQPELDIWVDGSGITSVAREDVVRIAFRRKGHYLEQLWANLIGSLFVPTTVLVPELRLVALGTPIIWAYTAVSTPVFLVAEVVSRLRLKPAKVIEIVQ